MLFHKLWKYFVFFLRVPVIIIIRFDEIMSYGKYDYILILGLHGEGVIVFLRFLVFNSLKLKNNKNMTNSKINCIIFFKQFFLGCIIKNDPKQGIKGRLPKLFQEVCIVVLSDTIAILLTPCLCAATENHIELLFPFSTKNVIFHNACIDPSRKVALRVLKLHLLPQLST